MAAAIKKQVTRTPFRTLQNCDVQTCTKGKRGGQKWTCPASIAVYESFVERRVPPRGSAGRAKFTGGRQGSLPNTTKTAGPNLSPSGTQLHQQSKKRFRKQGRPAKRWEDDLNIYSQPDRASRDNTDLTSDMTWLTSAEDSSKWDAMGSDFTSSRLKQPARPTTPITTNKSLLSDMLKRRTTTPSSQNS